MTERRKVLGTTTTSDPNVECPACHEGFVVQDAFEMGPGSEVECKNCGITLTCEDEDLTRHWTWSAPEKAK